MTRSKKLKAAIAAAVGASLRTRRRNLNLSYRELSRASGVGVSTIFHAEAGDTMLRVDTLLLLADALVISPETLLREAEYKLRLSAGERE